MLYQLYSIKTISCCQNNCPKCKQELGWKFNYYREKTGDTSQGASLSICHPWLLSTSLREYCSLPRKKKRNIWGHCIHRLKPIKTGKCPSNQLEHSKPKGCVANWSWIREGCPCQNSKRVGVSLYPPQYSGFGITLLQKHNKEYKRVRQLMPS